MKKVIKSINLMFSLMLILISTTIFKIINELEGAPRGAYCGSLGYFNFDGTGCWNILIRSIQKYQDQLSMWAGGGITVASDAEAEYQECFDKISAMLDLLNTWQKSEN